jgi:hypothetical protein
VLFDAFLLNSDGKTENQENDPYIVNKLVSTTMEKLMESTVELDKVINVNVSNNLGQKRSDALQNAMKTNIEQMMQEEQEVKKCRQEF